MNAVETEMRIIIKGVITIVDVDLNENLNDVHNNMYEFPRNIVVRPANEVEKVNKKYRFK